MPKTTRRTATRALFLACNAADDPQAKLSGRHLTLPASSISIEAAAGDSKSRKIAMLAYTGAAMRVSAFFYPVVIDLAGLDLGNSARPVLIDHERDLEHTLGQTTSVNITDGKVIVSAIAYPISETAKRVVAMNDAGFKFQSSVGVDVLNREFIAEGTTVTVNGQKFSGPINVARKTVLGEISFVTLGADDTTSARIAATAAKGSLMDFAKWLEAKGFTLADLSEAQKVSLKAMYDAEQLAATNAANAANANTANAGAANNGNGSTNANANANNASGANRAATTPSFNSVVANAEAEQARRTRITELTATALQDNPDKIELIKALGQTALDGGWDTQKYELELLRSSRSQAGVVRFGASSDRELTNEIVEAAVCIAGSLPNVEKRFKEPVLEAATRRWQHGLGLAELLITFARRNGRDVISARNVEPLLRAAFMQPGGMLTASAPSTLSLPGILANVANKFLRAGFDAVESTWREVAAIGSVRDFKQTSSYALTGDFKYRKVPPGGKIEHASPGEMSYTNRAETYGRMFAVDRRDIINDDMNALSQVPKRLGRGAALAFNDVFWTEFLADHTSGKTLFPTDNSKLNYIAGATPGTNDSRMNVEGLTRAETQFAAQLDPDGSPTAVIPKILLVPPGLSVTASTLMKAAEIRDTTAGVQTPTANPHAGKFRVATSAYLANANMGGAFSALAWYLLADPNDLPFIEAVFLNGQQAPTVESADADFDTLGIQYRGYHDFGVETQEYRAALKSKGAA